MFTQKQVENFVYYRNAEVAKYKESMAEVARGYFEEVPHTGEEIEQLCKAVGLDPD